MEVSVLKLAHMFHVFVEGDLGPVKHGWLVHVVPREETGCAPLVFLVQELARPPLTHLWVGEVGPARGTCRIKMSLQCVLINKQAVE